MTNGAATFLYHVANRMEKTVNHADVENLPESLARTGIDWINNCGIVDLVNVIFVLEYAGHGQQRTLLKDDPAEHNAESRDPNRYQRQQSLGAYFLRGMCCRRFV